VTGTEAPPGSRTHWRNWAGNERADTEVVRPASADEVAAVLTAAATAGRRVRPIGSGDSLSGIGRPEHVQLVCDGLAAVGEVG
jgi:FAD/FMN-containing dehydrogenase